VTGNYETPGFGSIVSISILSGLGNGDLGPYARHNTGPVPVDLAVADFNGDGHFDVANPNYHYPSNTVSVNFGTGDGSFSLNWYSTEQYPKEVDVGDFDGDGILDLLAECDRSITILPGRADSGLGASRDYGVFGYSPAAGDLNGDAYSDFVLLNTYIWVYLGSATGMPIQASNYVPDRGGGPMAFGRLNSDDVLDLVVANTTARTISVFLGRGDGTFGPRRDFLVSLEPSFLTVGDITGDAREDVVVSHSAVDKISVLLSAADGSLYPPNEFLVGDDPRGIALGDLNGDSRDDLVVANFGSASITVFMSGSDFPTAIRLRRLEAEWWPRGVRLSIDVDGTNGMEMEVERSETPPGPWIRITPEWTATRQYRTALDLTASAGTRYFYRVRISAADGQEATVLGPVEVAPARSRELAVDVFPNPGARSVHVEFDLDRAGPVRLDVLDLQGRLVATLIDRLRSAGPVRATWSPEMRRERSGPGVYFIRLAASGATTWRRVVVTR
jgi:hypothetical protein